MPEGVLQAVLGYMAYRGQPTVTVDLSSLNRRGRQRVYSGIARAALRVAGHHSRVVEFTATLGNRTEEERAKALHQTLLARFPEVVKPRRPAVGVFEELSTALEAVGDHVNKNGDRAVFLVRDFEPSAGQDDNLAAWVRSIHYGRANRAALKNVHLVMCSNSGPVDWRAHPLENPLQKRDGQAQDLANERERILWQAELLAAQEGTESPAYQRLEKKAESYSPLLVAARKSLDALSSRQEELPVRTSISLPPSARRVATVRARAKKALGTSEKKPDEIYLQLLKQTRDGLTRNGAYPVPSQDQLQALIQENGEIHTSTWGSWTYRTRSQTKTLVRYVLNVSLGRAGPGGKDSSVLSVLDRFVSRYGGEYKVFNARTWNKDFDAQDWSAKHETIVLRPLYALNSAEEQELASAVQPFVRGSEGLLGYEIPAPGGEFFPGIRRNIEPDAKTIDRLVERAERLDPKLGAVVKDYLGGGWMAGPSPSGVYAAETVISRLEASLSRPAGSTRRRP